MASTLPKQKMEKPVRRRNTRLPLSKPPRAQPTWANYLSTRRPRITQAQRRLANAGITEAPTPRTALRSKKHPVAELAVHIPSRTDLSWQPQLLSGKSPLTPRTARRSIAPSPEDVRLKSWFVKRSPVSASVREGRWLLVGKAEDRGEGESCVVAREVRGAVEGLVSVGLSTSLLVEGGLSGASCPSGKTGNGVDVEGEGEIGGMEGVELENHPGVVPEYEAPVEVEGGQEENSGLGIGLGIDLGTGSFPEESRVFLDNANDLIFVMSDGSVRSVSSSAPAIERDVAMEVGAGSKSGVKEPGAVEGAQEERYMDLEADLDAALMAELFGESDGKEGGETASEDDEREQVQKQWDDCVKADECWRQFDHGPTPVDGPTPREAEDQDMDERNTPSRSAAPAVIIDASENVSQIRGDHATEAVYQQQSNQNAEPDILQMQANDDADSDEAAATDAASISSSDSSEDSAIRLAFSKAERRRLRGLYSFERGYTAEHDLDAGRQARVEDDDEDEPPMSRPSRPIPSNLRVDKQQECDKQPRLKLDEASIWDTVDAFKPATFKPAAFKSAASAIKPATFKCAAAATPAYTAWQRACAAFFACKSGTVAFPSPRKWVRGGGGACDRRGCVRGEVLGVCHHDVRALLEGSGCLSVGWAKKERVRWHPDRFVGREEAVAVRAGEMFRLVQRLVEGFEDGEM